MSLCFLSQNHNASRTDEGVCPYLWYYLRMQKALFTPLSIRRGDGGEASPPLRGGWVGFPTDGICLYF